MFTVKYNIRLQARVTHRKHAMGTVVLFDNSLNSTTYSIRDLGKIFSKLQLAQNDEFLNARIIEMGKNFSCCKSGRNSSELMAIFDSQFVRRIFKKSVFANKMNILSAFNLALDSYLLHEIEDSFYPRTKEELEVVEFLRKRLLLRFESVLFQDKIREITKNSIVVVNEFKKEYFLALPQYIKGMICKDAKNYSLAEIYSNEYQFPVAIYNYDFEEDQHVIIDGDRQEIVMYVNEIVLANYRDPINKRKEYIERKLDIDSKLIKIFSSVPDNRDLNEIASSDWSSGVCTFRSEFQYGTKGTIPTLEEQTNKFIELLMKMKDKEVFIGLPDFRPDKPFDMMENEYTDITSFLNYIDVFNTNITAIALASQKTRNVAKIVIPMIRLSTEMDFWKASVEAVFDGHRVNIPPIGMMVETESSLEYFEDYEKQEFIIIGLDNLIEELMDGYNRYSDIAFEDFKFDLLTDLKELHQHYRSYFFKTRHIVSGHCLRNPKILEKLIKLGFKEFVIPINDLPDVGEVIINHINSRGKHIGVAAQRAEKKQEKAKEK